MNSLPVSSAIVSRRHFTVGGAGALASLFAQASLADVAASPQSLHWENWSGLQHAQPHAMPLPLNEAEVQTLMARSNGEMRALGSGHSFTPLVPTNGAIVSLDRMSGLVSVDKAAMTATVMAGTRLGVLSRALDAQGLALRNLPDVDGQTIAGAISTGTHGTGATLRALHADVVAMRIVTPDGKIVELQEGRDADMLAGAKVALGSLGVISQVVIQVVPAYNLQRKVWLKPVEELLLQAPELAVRHRHFEMFVLPFTGYAAAVVHDVYDGSDLLLPKSADDDVMADLRRLRDWLGHFPAARTWMAQRFIDSNQTEEARHRAYRLLSSVRPIRFNETESHVPAAQGIACLRQVVATIEKHNEAFFPIEFRYVRADDAWLSPFHGRDSCSIAVHAAAGEAHDYLTRDCAPIFRAYQGRPHWGKLHALGAMELSALYPRWADFQRLRRSMDPKGHMLNTHLRNIFGAA